MRAELRGACGAERHVASEVLWRSVGSEVVECGRVVELDVEGRGRGWCGVGVCCAGLSGVGEKNSLQSEKR